uniref:RWD domain-containing protein n=1 Tax=Steinernema glaseri TaxID=37863 RepID=A0A1I7Y1Q9_9BILA
MDYKSEQATEMEVLNSIYEGDPLFHQSAENKVQYKFGEEGHYQSFVMEVVWTETYPDTVPDVNLDVFYNANITRDVRDSIRDAVLAEAENYVGMASTFSLIEYVKENYAELVKNQMDPALMKQVEDLKLDSDDKKDQMTKAQKRKMWNKVEAGKCGQLERGHDWIDIVKHLSQAGKAVDA